MSAKALVEEQVKSLSTICELEPDVTKAFQDALLQVAERHLSAQSSSSGGDKIKLEKKAGTKKASKPKEDKISHKNAYHFFVAAKMPEVKAEGVEAKGRMKSIGEKWKALAEPDRQPYKDMAVRYNDYVNNAMKSGDWKDHRDDIVASANRSAGINNDQGDEADGDDAEEDTVSTISTTSTAISTAPSTVSAPVQVTATAPAAVVPTQQNAPIRKNKTKKP